MSAVVKGWLLGVLWGCLGLAQANGLADLERFLQDTQQGRRAFTQVVSPPAAPAGEVPRRAKTSSGEFSFLRPDRFRFQYLRPFEQTIVADGERLWLYDVDLAQVTVRAQREALGQTPVALLTAAADLKALRQAFELSAEPAVDGTHWVRAVPRQRDGQLNRVRIGFQAGQLTALEILDGFGQRSLITFSPINAPANLKPTDFRFAPPPGVDVIRQ
jgi:outer membrane lipoprotein carrier protein